MLKELVVTAIVIGAALGFVFFYASQNNNVMETAYLECYRIGIPLYRPGPGEGIVDCFTWDGRIVQMRELLGARGDAR